MSRAVGRVAMDSGPKHFTSCGWRVAGSRTSRTISGNSVRDRGLHPGCRSVYYSTWEKFGKYKRDLLQSKVKEVRDDQKETTEQLKDALNALAADLRIQRGRTGEDVPPPAG